MNDRRRHLVTRRIKQIAAMVRAGQADTTTPDQYSLPVTCQPRELSLLVDPVCPGGRR